VGEFARFNNTRHVPFTIQQVNLAPCMNVRLLRIIRIEQYIVWFFERVAFPKNKLAAHAFKGRKVYPRNCCPAGNKMAGNTRPKLYVRKFLQFFDELYWQVRETNGSNARVGRSHNNVGADTSGTLARIFDEAMA